MTDTHPSLPVPPSRRPLPRISWWFSTIFAVALIGLIGTLIYAQTTSAQTFQLTVVAQGTGEPVPEAEVKVGNLIYQTNADGRLVLPASAKLKPVHVTGDGFDSWYTDVGIGTFGAKTIELNTLAASQQDSAPETTPGIDQATPPDATPSSVAQPTTESTSAPGTPEAQSFQLEGKISDESGTGIQGARVVVRNHVAVTGKDGLFSVALDDTADAAVTATFIAPGYLQQTIDVPRSSPPLHISLESHQIKAIYLNPNVTETEADVDRLVDMIDSTELNAVVIDIKEELIYYDSQVEFFVDSGTVQPVYDIEALLKKFHDRGIYTIARLVVFKDSIVAEKHPDLAVLNSETGDLWRDMNGVAWVNPMDHELWEANTDLALEAAKRGFDEIQFDYVRFPTDGDLTTMDFGLENTQEIRQRSIEKFLQMAQEKVHPTGAKLSADVFGYTMLVDDDLGIGQNFINLAQYVDYLSPMIYPSHFPDNSIAVDGHPNDHPYETIEISLRLGREKLGGDAHKIRPWLQDFNYFDMMPYGDEEVRAQIDASADIGTSGWMLWDPNNVYHPGALEDDAPDSAQVAFTPPVALDPKNQ